METSTAPVDGFLDAVPGLFIGGDFVESVAKETFTSVNPSTGQALASVQRARSADVDRAVAAARAAFDEDSYWRRMTPAQRGRVIHRIGDLILENAEKLALLEALDSGKSIEVARSSDVVLAANLFHYMSGWATKIEGNTIPLTAIPGDYTSYTLREPVGVAGQIIPWNFPLVMASWKLGPALATGCTVVLKPAEETPLSAMFLAQLLEAAGLPPGVVNIVTGFGEEAGAALAAHPGVDKIAFTGSTEVGRLVARAATGNLKNVSLELGGKSPNIIFDDADLELAITGAAQGIFFHQGQCCNAGSRLFVQASVFDDVVAGVAERAHSYTLGPATDPDFDMGPLVSQKQMDRVLSYISIGSREGAKAVTGGQSDGDAGYFVRPTVFTDVGHDMTVAREEIFGPVVVVIRFEDPDEVIALANDTPYGLAAGVFTRDLSRAHKMAKRLRAGTVWVNTYGMFDAAMPFGGFKQSGWGREMGHEVLEHYLETKSVLIRL